jgi:hypothetical protein
VAEGSFEKENRFDRTISRATAESENGFVVRLYRTDDGTLLTYEELYDEVDAEGSALPPEQWRGGEWDANEYIIEACLVGIYDIEEVLATVVQRHVDGKQVGVVEYVGDDDQVVAVRRVDQG